VSCQCHGLNSQPTSKDRTDHVVGVNKTIQPRSASRVAPIGLNCWDDDHIQAIELNLAEDLRCITKKSSRNERRWPDIGSREAATRLRWCSLNVTREKSEAGDACDT
jgi:hypothetical protein